MNNWTARIASLALLVAFVDRAPAQSRPTPNAIKSIGTCVTVQTNATTVETPIPLRAVGSCEIAQGGPHSCTVEIVPTGPDIILDVSDRDGTPQCLRLMGGDPCILVQNGPVIFQSPRHATQSFSGDAEPVRMTIMIRQIGCSKRPPIYHPPQGFH